MAQCARDTLEEFGQDTSQPHALLHVKPAKDVIQGAHARAESLRKHKRSLRRAEVKSKHRENMESKEKGPNTENPEEKNV